MNAWFVRHTKKLGVLDKDVDRLWAEDRVAIHFPGQGPEDSESLDPKDYSERRAKIAIARFGQLAREGGYIWSDYRNREAKVGFVQPQTQIEIRDGTWGDRHPGRTAKLKTLQLVGVKTIAPGEWGSLRVARPRQGTISRWNKASSKLACIVDGKTIEHAWNNLSFPLQETVCSEFLRSHNISELPKLKWLLLPVGGTQEDIDIYGLTTEGKKLFAQVTYSKKRVISEKIKKLSKYHRDGAQLIMFCQCGVREIEGNVYYVPVETDVFNWFEDNKQYAESCFSRG